MYDADLSARAGNWRTAQGRKVIVIVTDGGDTTSSRDFQQALEAAQMADAVITRSSSCPSPTRPGETWAARTRSQPWREGTGGRVFAPPSAPQLDQAFSDIISELRTQYLLGFYPAGRAR